jgi:hypothetical protein
MGGDPRSLVDVGDEVAAPGLRGSRLRSALIGFVPSLPWPLQVSLQPRRCGRSRPGSSSQGSGARLGCWFVCTVSSPFRKPAGAVPVAAALGGFLAAAGVSSAGIETWRPLSPVAGCGLACRREGCSFPSLEGTQDLGMLRHVDACKIRLLSVLAGYPSVHTGIGPWDPATDGFAVQRASYRVQLR